jgi:uncharacterized membrane protein YkvA (DUF1232 family)
MAEERLNLLQRMKAATKHLRREVLVMYLALRHPDTPWYAKVLALAVVAYAASPIDLIPDPVPVLGYLDDIILVPLGVMAVRRLIPAVVMEDCRARAEAGVEMGRGFVWAGGVMIGVLWVLCLVVMGWAGWKWMHGGF